MKPSLKYIISLLILLLSFSGYTQDSLKGKENVVVLSIVVDYGKLVESLFNQQTKWEFGVDFQFLPHYKLVTEYGFASLNPQNSVNNGSYNSEGNYFRLGLEYIFILNANRYLSTGFMYGNSNFRDKLNVQIISEFWQSVDLVREREGLSANWIEWVLNTEGPTFNTSDGPFSKLSWGMKFRIRFLITDITQPEVEILAIPGYGRTYSNVVPAVNLFLKYRIVF